MNTFELNGVEMIDLEGRRPEQKWVFDFVLDEVEKNLDRVNRLDWFVFRQLLGEVAWTRLQQKKQHHGAGRCFAYLIDHDLFPVERVRQTTKGTHYYRVKH